MKAISKELEQVYASIKPTCEAVVKNLNEGKTPKEIADMFGAKYEFREYDEEYDECDVDFEHFGINFWSYKGKNEWHWENEDEIYVFGIQDWESWKRL